MPAFLETVGDGVFILRAGPQAEQYGDPYTASGTVVATGVGICEVRGFTRRNDDTLGAVAILRDTQRCLRAADFKQFKWERRRKRGHKTITVSTNGLL